MSEKTTAICDNCGKVFVKKNTGQKRCSPECSKEVMRKSCLEYKRNEAAQAGRKYTPFHEIACVICGKMFMQRARIQKACSPSCAKKLKYQTARRYRADNAEYLKLREAQRAPSIHENSYPKPADDKRITRSRNNIKCLRSNELYIEGIYYARDLVFGDIRMGLVSRKDFAL